MKNLFHYNRLEPKFRGVFKNTETVDSSEVLDKIADKDLAVGNYPIDTDALASLFARIITPKMMKLFELLWGDLDEETSDESDESDENPAKNDEVKKTISKKYETAKFTKDILNNSRLFIGLNEAKDGDRDRELIKKFHEAANLKATAETPWCASFVSYILKKSGVKISGSARAKDFLKKGVPVKKEELKKGDVIVYDRGGEKGHVGFFTGKYKGDVPIIIAGNTSDEVKEYAEYLPIVGYRRFT